MTGHWSELVDSLCDLRGTYTTEFADVERAVDVARGYVRELRFPTLLAELDEETLNGAVMEADALLSDEADMTSLQCPSVLALTFTAHALLHGGGDGTSILASDKIEEGCRRVAAFIIIEKMRRLEVYEQLSLPFDPWDDETNVVCEGENQERLNALKRWLGYTVEGD